MYTPFVMEDVLLFILEISTVISENYLSAPAQSRKSHDTVLIISSLPALSWAEVGLHLLELLDHFHEDLLSWIRPHNQHVPCTRLLRLTQVSEK
jgi:hypothetical protein